MLPLVIFVGAGLGGLARYALSEWAQTAVGTNFPWGTLAINVTGSLLLAVIYGLLETSRVPSEWRAFLGIGFCGGYTTFSTFSYETIRLVQDGEWQHAVCYVLGSVLVSLVGVIAGFRLASTILRKG